MTVLVTHLRMEDPAQLRPAATFPGLTLREVRDPAVNATLYAEVGGPYAWHDRRGWTREEWAGYALAPTTRTLLGTLGEETVGYGELVRLPEGDVELRLFGLRPSFVGQGLGGALLTLVTWEAWQWGARRVVLSTCTLDHPRALPAYLARGFTALRTEAHAH
ncbi:hypothetical protein DAETH_31910 [Deinococcus aetherius]|uniref:N-acetyltransferase domain-containing protein n=1 Tax=Deinococcus aetherius TaxID=200252 RepID=A0ABM8AHE5_9DEIO|nr:GNAT family N-acetyltransferase [Deinococcus aetherius]BDP43222.1 hypothetical protein DAETH_31910 [Deinococcus aetherius]